MGWFSRKTAVGTLKSDIRQASGLPLDQRMKLASEMEEFIEEMRSVMQTPDHPSELMRLFQLHGANRKAQVPGGFSALWAHHAFRESYLLALIKAPDDPKWFKEVHTLLHGIRGPLGLIGIESPPQKSDPGRVKPRETYYENGQLQTKSTYVAGKKDGPIEWYYENGQLLAKSTYVAGEQDGLNETYYENGQLKRKGNYVAGNLDGPHERYYENGQFEWKRTFAAGKFDGPYEDYYENGQFEWKRTFAAGKCCDGPWEDYYENGQLKQKGTSVDGEQDGLYELYHENGQLQQKGVWNMGEACGEWITDGETVTYDPCPDTED